MRIRPFTSEEMAAVYGRACDTYDSIIPSFATFGRRLVDLAAVGPGDDVLDVAAGRGASLLPAAAAAGPTGIAAGIDLSQEMVRALAADVSALEGRNCSVLRMDAEALAFAGSSFDVVLCGSTIQLLPQPRMAVAGFFRVLRPGGRVGLSIPSEASPGWGFFVPLIARYAHRAQGPMPPVSSPDHDFAAILGSTGFEDLKIIEHTASFVFPDEHAWWRWVWSVGLRAYLEPLATDDLAQLKATAFSHLRRLARPDGLHLDMRARFLLGRRPSQ